MLVLLGLWLLRLIQATSAACPPPAAPVNCQVTSTGDLATYTCDPGYTIFGSSSLRCNDGKWEGDLPVCATNIAYKRPANQSTTIRNGEAAKANDGHVTFLHEGHQCAVTSLEGSPWWRVDLLQSYEVVVVRVVTRACCEVAALQNLEVRVGDSTDTQQNRLCAWLPGTVGEGVVQELRCALPLRGRYVVVQTVGVEAVLSLCEVEVYSTEEFAKERCSTTADITTLGVFNKTCYEFQVKDGRSFEAARSKCQQTDSSSTAISLHASNSSSVTSADLAHSISQVTHGFLTSELERRKDDLKADLVWIGVKRDTDFISRTWRWVDGTIVDHTRWGRAQPNNYNGKQNCVALDKGRAWMWNDVGCELDYLPYVCQYAPRSCGTPDKKVNTTIDHSATGTGAIVTYSCPEGSLLIGNESRTCLGTGLWSGAAPSCKYINCGTPEVIENGEVVYTDSGRTTYNASVTYTCASNYSLQGSAVRVCAEDGVWTPAPAPTCLYGWCPTLDAPAHGGVTMNGQKAGDTADFYCESGYLLVGPKTLSCRLGGDWSDKIPGCKFVDCGVPVDIPNGMVSLDNRTTTLGSTVTYNCAPNFWLSGAEVRECGKDGSWSGVDPECVLVTCGEPEVPAGGFVTGYSFQVGSEVTYQCDPGHRLVTDELDEGHNTENGGSVKEFSDFEAETKENLSNDKENGNADQGGEIEKEAQKTERGNEEENDSNGIEHAINKPKVKLFKRICRQDGLWSGGVPGCIYTDCGHVPAVPRGTVTYHNHTTYLGSVLSYDCVPSYRVKGSRVRTCLEDGSWSGSHATCQEVRCSPPPDGRDDEAKLLSVSGNDRRLSSTYVRRRGPVPVEESYRIGTVATYGCPKGYVVNGTTAAAGTTITTTSATITTAASTAALRTCVGNGTWLGSIPTCSYVDCGMPERIDKGFYRLLSNTTHFGSQVAYECVPNFRVDGRIRRHCLSNGTWAGVSPTCVEIRCPNLATTLTEALKVNVDRNGTVGSVASYSCETGRRLVGNMERLCGRNGAWSGSAPRCEWVSCTMPRDIENGRLVRLNETLIYGTVVEYHCLPRHELRGDFMRSCGADETWTGVEPVCLAEDDGSGIYTILDDNSLARGGTATSTTTAGASNTGLYIGLVFGLFLVAAFVAALVFLRMRQRGGGKLGRTRGVGEGGGGEIRPPLPPPNDHKMEVNHAMTYSSLTDPITGNNIYENIDEEEVELGTNNHYYNCNNNHHNNGNYYQNTSDMDSATISSTTPTTTTTTATATTVADDTTATSQPQVAGINRTTNISSRRPRLPPPQPPTIPTTTVTINGVTIAENC